MAVLMAAQKTPLLFRQWGNLMTRLLVVFISCLLICAPSLAQKRVALTFDDIPRGTGAFFTPDERAIKLIAALKCARVEQAAFFVNPGSLIQPHGRGGEERIQAYVAAGHVIANHTNTHPGLSDTKVSDYIADIDAAEKWLRGRDGYRPWFRFPFLDEGRADKNKRDRLRIALAERGLRNGYVTIDSSDWNMEALTKQAFAEGKSVDMEALKALYIETFVDAANFYDQLAVKTLGRSPAHVYLLHETDLAALYIEDAIAALRADGWEIISADEAFADPLGQQVPDVPSAQGTLTESLAWQKGLPAPRWYERNYTPLAKDIFNKRVLKEK
jgi:peptidoglycan/xylan/chitin deacetylase (PgdA/CDA1 family)